MSSLLKKAKYAAKTVKAVTKGLASGEDLKCSKEETEARMEVCKGCPKLAKFLGKDQCLECGCILNLKVTLKDAKCPLLKWE